MNKNIKNLLLIIIICFTTVTFSQSYHTGKGKVIAVRFLELDAEVDTAEFEKPLINEFLLKKISEISGGRHRILNDSDDLSTYQFANPDVQVKSYSRSFSLWDNWWAYSLMVGFLVMDWFLRRKSGLS